MRSASPAASLPTRRASAICARVISTASQAPPATALGRHVDVDDRALGDDHDLGRQGRAHAAGQVEVEPGGDVAVRPGGRRRVDRAADHRHVVHERGEGDRHLDGGLRRDPRPRRQLVARQPQPDHGVGADGLADRQQHRAGEQQPVRPPLVVALVGEARQELPHQAVLAGVDLDPVAPGPDGDPGGGREPVDDGGDVGRLHPLGHLAGVDLGHPRGCEQRRLAVRARPLAPCMPERCEHQRCGARLPPLGVAGLGDGGPALGAVRRQRAALVGPVAGVDRRLLDHDHARPSRGAAPVVGDVAVGQGATAGQVGLVRPEHDAVAGGPGPPGQRVEQAHQEEKCRSPARSGLNRAGSAPASPAPPSARPIPRARGRRPPSRGRARAVPRTRTRPRRAPVRRGRARTRGRGRRGAGR